MMSDEDENGDGFVDHETAEIPPDSAADAASERASTLDERAFQTPATYRALANSLPLSLLIKAADGRRVFANEAYLKWRDLRWEDVAGKTDHELFPRSIADRYTEDDRKVLQDGTSSHAVEETRLSDGSLRWIERVKSPIHDVNGRLIGLQVLFWDVTAKIEAEKAIRYEQSLLATLLDSIPDSIYFKDLDSRFIRVSRAMAEKFGQSDVEKVHGRTDADIFTAHHAQAAREDEVHIMQTGEPLVDRIERETWPDQEDTWCLTTKMPLRDEDGKVIGTFGISRDITDLKRSEAKLQEAVRMADAANRAKSEFLANMSHEIRTPMNAMVGMADLLAQTELDEDQRDYVETIRQSSDSLLRLLNDILDFSKIEARRLELESVVFSLTYEAQAAISTLRWQASEKDLQLKLRCDENVPDYFIGDPGRLRQILVNLIGNAVKFTDHGEVTVAIECEPFRESEMTLDPRCRVRVSVQDTGIGIPPGQQAAVLAPFTQADASTTRRFGGTGLGLSISRQLVELMGGTLRLQSEVGVGTTFYFDLNLVVAEAGPAIVASDEDDEEDLGGALFRKSADPGKSADPATSGRGRSSPQELPPVRPLRVLVAEDGVTNQHVIAGLLRSLGHECSIASDGRETLAKWRSETFDLILMDMHMPVMDGLEATRAIRQQELGTADHIPIIALTAAAMTEDARLCREAGMDDYLTKPIHRRKLQRTLSVFQQTEPHPRKDAHQEAETRQQKFEPENPAVLLMSPDSGANSGNPLTVADEGSLTVAEESGAKAFSVRASRPVDGGSTGSSDMLALSQANAGCLDLDSARSRIPGGASGVMRLATVFKGECESLLAHLESNFGAADNDAARRNAHTLKGACGLLGAKGLQAVAGEIESAGRDGKLGTPETAGPLLESLRQQANRVLAAIDELLNRGARK